MYMIAQSQLFYERARAYVDTLTIRYCDRTVYDHAI